MVYGTAKGWVSKNLVKNLRAVSWGVSREASWARLVVAVRGHVESW